MTRSKNVTDFIVISAAKPFKACCIYIYIYILPLDRLVCIDLPPVYSLFKWASCSLFSLPLLQPQVKCCVWHFHNVFLLHHHVLVDWNTIRCCSITPCDMVHNVALLHVRCEPGVLNPLTRDHIRAMLRMHTPCSSYLAVLMMMMVMIVLLLPACFVLWVQACSSCV